MKIIQLKDSHFRKSKKAPSLNILIKLDLIFTIILEVGIFKALFLLFGVSFRHPFQHISIIAS